MPAQLIIVEKSSDFRWSVPGVRVITAQDFIAEGPGLLQRPRRIINLCRSYAYLSIGYYVSLLAEARGERVTPSMEAITDLQVKAVQAQKLAGLERCLGPLASVPKAVEAMRIQVFFGQVEERNAEDRGVEDRGLAEFAGRSFELFRCPLLAIDLERLEDGAGWKVAALHPLDLRDVDLARDGLFLDGLTRFCRRPWRHVTGALRRADAPPRRHRRTGRSLPAPPGRPDPPRPRPRASRLTPLPSLLGRRRIPRAGPGARAGGFAGLPPDREPIWFHFITLRCTARQRNKTL